MSCSWVGSRSATLWRVGVDVNAKQRNAKLLEIIGAYDGLSDEAATDALNAPTIPKVGAAPSSLLNKWAAVNGVRKSIYQVSENYDHSAYEAASAARFAMENTAEELDLADAEVQALVAALVAAGVFSQAAADDLYARVTTVISPAQAAGLPPIKVGWVIAARAAQ